MAEPPNIQQDSSDPLRLDRCPDRGGLLIGLPPRGQCPECGAAYDADRTLVLYGYGYGARRTGINARWFPRLRSAVVVLVLGSFLVAMIRTWLSTGTLRPPRVPTADIYVFFSLLSLVIVLFRRHQIARDAPRPAQLRIGAAGYAPRDGVGPADLLPWGPQRHLRIQKLGARRYRIRSCRFQPFILGRRSSLVDFEFEADDAAFASLRERIAAWQGTVP